MELSDDVVAPPFSAQDAEELLDFFGDHESFFDVEMTPPLPVTDCVVMAPPIVTTTTASNLAAPTAFKLEAPTFQFGTAASSPASTRASDADSPPRSSSETASKKKSTFQRQKEELVYLRSKIAGLEAKLKNLRGMDRTSSTSATSGRPVELEQSLRQVASSLSLWQGVAKHQQSERNRAEQENTELRKLLKEHAGLAKSLKRMLRKRMVAFAGAQASEPQRLQEISEKDSEVFQVLQRSVKDRAKRVDQLFASHGLTSTTTSLNTTRVVSDSDGQDEHAEFVDARLLAFEFRSLFKTIWSLLTSKPDEHQHHEVNFSNNMLCVKHQVTPSDPSDPTSGSTVVFSVHKQISHENRMVLLWERLVERNEPAASRIPVVYLSQFGYSQVIRVDDDSDSKGIRVPRSLVQSYVQLKPLQMKPRVGSLQAQPGSTTTTTTTTSPESAVNMETIIASYQKGQQSFLHLVENELDAVVRDINNVKL